MSLDNFQQQIQELQRHLTSMQHQAQPQQIELLTEVFQELNAALEELEAGNVRSHLFDRVRDISDRKRQELERQKISECCQLVATALDCLIYDWQIKTRTVERTQGIINVLGYHPEEAEPTLSWWTSRIHPDDTERVRNAIKNALANSSEYTVEYRVCHKSDRYLYIQDKGVIVRNARGKAVRVVGSTTDISASKQAEIALQESKQRLSQLAANVPGVIYQYLQHQDGSMTFPYISPGSREIFEVEPTAVQQNAAAVMNLVHPDDRKSLEDSIAASAETLQPWTWEGRFIVPSGTLKWLRGVSRPELQANGDILWDGLLIDVTACKQTELALQESEQRFRQLAENIHQVCWISTLDREHILYINPAYETVWGRSCASLYEQPQSWLEAIHPDDRDRVISDIENKPEQTYKHEYRIIRPDRSLRWIQSDVIALKDDTGQVYRLVGIKEDITERKLVEEALGRREQEFRTLIENAPDTIARFDRQLRHLYVNPAVEQLTGLLPQEFFGKTNRQLELSEPNLSNWERMMEQIFETGLEAVFEFSFVTPHGLKQYSSRFVPEFAADGTVESILGITRDVTALKEIEEQLRESEHRFRTSVENMLDAYGIGSAIRDELGQIIDFRIEYVNAAACESSQMTKEEMIGNRLCELFPNQRLTGMFDEYVQVVETGQPLVKENLVYEEVLGEVRLTRAYDVRATKLNDGFVALWRDITTRKQAEEALRESEEHLRTVIQNMPVMMKALDKNGNFIVWNRECEQVTGYSTAEIVGNPLAFELLYPDTHYREQMLNQWRQRGNFYRDWEWQLTTKNRQVKTVSWFNISERFPIPSWESWGIGIDVTEGKRVQDALLESEQWFRQLAENIQEVFWITSLDHSQVIYVSPAYEKVWGRTCESLYAQPFSWLEAIHPEERDRVFAALAPQKATEYNQEFRIILSDGTIRWIRDRGFPVQNEQGQIYRLAGLAEDITVQKLAEAETAKALQQERLLNELKSRFISITSHEFRTPLTGILSSAELLEHYRDRFSDEKQRTHLRRIQTSVGQMKQLLDDVLLIGKAEAGKLEFNPKPLDLVEFCTDLVADLQLTDKNGHEIAFTHQGSCTLTTQGTNQSDDVLPVLDEKLLRHILGNLLSNATKYSPSGGAVEFNLTCLDNQAIFRIQDTGIGIPSEDIPHLFETFHRASNVGTIQGTGLGLAIVKQCVDLHRGEITVESIVGSGTTFTVILPLS